MLWPLFAVAAMLAALGLAAGLKERQAPLAPALVSDAMAANMLVYDRAAAEFAKANAGVSGLIDSSLLGLRPSYQNVGGWQSRVLNGRMMTYQTTPTRFSPDIAYALTRYSHGQLLAGVAQSTPTCQLLIHPFGECVSDADFLALSVSAGITAGPVVFRKLR